jgi:hypothetical protein
MIKALYNRHSAFSTQPVTVFLFSGESQANGATTMLVAGEILLTIPKSRGEKRHTGKWLTAECRVLNAVSSTAQLQSLP